MSANLAAIDELVEEFLKMELISVPPYPGQLGYLGSTKVNAKRQTALLPIVSLALGKAGPNHHRPGFVNRSSSLTRSFVFLLYPASTAASTHFHLRRPSARLTLCHSLSNPLTASPHEDALQKLTQRLESELRIAKRQHLACTEVLLPADLLPRISSQMFELSEKEPCGIRGCTIYIEFEDEPDNTRRIATMKTDPNTVSTFELYLTLKQDRRGWTSILPQFLKNLARGSTIMISPEFVLTKNKLYHAYSD
ncbi:AGAP011600-PA-like protein [Anopheles sinensis]|uniref:AGAP011600-PA-like protein n=1 Tax=Anopheles sinensis TaxID=74873 RepID=A0A084WGN3_ANOSI|nr:AGAP011600-PA-like protein [Anopheles sinensis]